MDFDTANFWEILLWSFWVFIWISAVLIWVRCLFDLFSDDTTSGWGKAGWSVILVFLPWAGALIYLIARGRGMGERQLTAIQQQQASQEAYIKSVAAAASPSEQITQGKALLDSGAISHSEFEALKTRALT